MSINMSVMLRCVQGGPLLLMVESMISYIAEFATHDDHDSLLF